MTDESKDESKNRTPSFKKLSATFLLSFFGVSSKLSPADAKVEVALPSISNDPLTCPVNPSFDPAYQIGLPMTPNIDANQFVSKFIVGSNSEQEHQRVIDVIQMARAIGPEVSKTIDLVLTHSPKFSIAIYDPEDIEGLHHDVVYMPGTHTVIINRQLLMQPDLLTILIHEFRHAMWQTLHNLQGDEKKLGRDPFLPGTEKEKANFERMVAKGDKRLTELRSLLQLEEKGKASDTLNSLRKRSAADYKRFFQATTDAKDKVTLTAGYIENVEKRIGKKLQEGTQFFLPGYGPVTIKKVYQATHSPGAKAFDLEFNDPVYGAVYRMERDRLHIGKAYPPGHFPAELEAYLFSNIPTTIRTFVYAELIKNTNRLLQTAEQTPATLTMPIPDYLSLYEHNVRSILIILADSKDYDPDQVPYYIEWADIAVNMGHLEAAKIGLHKLLTHNDRVSEANLSLARIYYQEGNYTKSLNYYNAFEKSGNPLSAADNEKFLKATKSAKKIQQQAAQAAGISSTEIDSQEESISSLSL